MAERAKAFLASLSDEQRASARRPFDAPERTNWSYVRGNRAGLFLRDMTAAQKALALDLMKSGLSEEGIERVRIIRAIEEANGNEEKARNAPITYGEDLYAIFIFGEPSEDPAAAPWGWRAEGHHIGLHFSSVAGDVTSTPLFFGAFPASLALGADKGARPLSSLQEAAFALRRSLSDEQMKRATVGATCPADVLTGPGREAALKDPATFGGIAMADLTQAQRDLLWALVVRHASDLRGDLASEELRRIKAAGLEAIRFGFIGEPALDKPHYYRVGGPTFVIEFDCTQGNPDHVHCLWNDPARNFGGDVLREHVEREHR